MSTIEETTAAWFDAQRKLIEQWNSLIMPGVVPAPQTTAPEQEQQTSADDRQTTGTVTEPIAKMVVDQMINAQESTRKLMEMTANAWQAMAPQMASGGDWQAALEQYTNQLRNTLTAAPTTSLPATQDVGQLWQTYLEQAQKFGQPWFNAGTQALQPLTQFATGDVSALNQIAGLGWDAYNQTFARLINTPAMGLNRETNERQVAAFNAWVELQKANSQYQIVLADIWTKAFRRFMETLGTRVQTSEPITSVREFINLWTDLAEEVFGDEFRSPEYVDAQGQLLNTTMAFQLRQRDLIEPVARSLGLPTRSDVDEAHKSIYELRKDVKAIKKAQRQEQADSTIDDLRNEIAELKEAQPDMDSVLDSLDDLRKQVKKLRKELEDQRTSGDETTKKGGRKRKGES